MPGPRPPSQSFSRVCEGGRGPSGGGVIYFSKRFFGRKTSFPLPRVLLGSVMTGFVDYLGWALVFKVKP